MQGIKLEFICIYLVQSLQSNKWIYLPPPKQCRIKASELVIWSLIVPLANMSLFRLSLFYASIKSSLYKFSNQVEIITHCLPFSVWFCLISLSTVSYKFIMLSQWRNSFPFQIDDTPSYIHTLFFYSSIKILRPIPFYSVAMDSTYVWS